ncbi:MAG: Uma2 family endonuclease [Gomphosphaeria aponina SAG 52.96 = DSM 107014]|uniref:Uma2 family endonuclease n=1 Tax=Gomphosphaeria aponina SAG 52.96 = DSM 107014 TaxID=1521640 RepID=A0A941JRW0_9CHRO|nr:Uma2 family endonuclease [Gomphosphaeria aponina SAG 52.96 = DSM 107014]
MVQTLSQSITLAEFLELPETKPAREYINGKIIQKPMPPGKHSTIQGELVTAINSDQKYSPLSPILTLRQQIYLLMFCISLRKFLMNLNSKFQGHLYL